MARTVTAQLSVGDLVDRLTIADIKSKRTNSDAARSEFRSLFFALCDFLGHRSADVIALERFRYELTEFKDARPQLLLDTLWQVNNTLWDKENTLQRFRELGDSSSIVAELAFSIRADNLFRSKIKQALNESFNSGLPEVKAYG